MIRNPRLSDPVFTLVDEVIRVNGRLKSVFAGATAETGMSSLAYTVFTAVSEAATAPTVPQIGRSLGHARQVIQRAVNELIAAGMIEAAHNPDHKRAPLLRPTPLGATFKDKSDTLAIGTANALLKHVDRELCRRIAADLGELRGQIENFLREGDADRGAGR